MEFCQSEKVGTLFLVGFAFWYKIYDEFWNTTEHD